MQFSNESCLLRTRRRKEEEEEDVKRGARNQIILKRNGHKCTYTY